MGNKTLGYILLAAGIIIVALSYPQFRAMLKLPFSLPINDIYILGAGAILLILGAMTSFRGSGKQPKEVPIFHGKHIVGYRRMK